MGRPLVIWWISTTRRLAVENDAALFLPAMALPYLEIPSDKWSYIYGDFKVCPTEPDVPGHMRSVCAAEARNLVVQRVNGTQPPVHLWSTWALQPDNNGRSEDGMVGLLCDSTFATIANAKVVLDVGSTQLHNAEGEIRDLDSPQRAVEWGLRLKEAEWDKQHRFLLVIVTAEHLQGSGSHDSVFVYRCDGQRVVRVFWTRKEDGADVDVQQDGFTMKSAVWTADDAHCCPSFERTERFAWSPAKNRVVRTANRLTPRPIR